MSAKETTPPVAKAVEDCHQLLRWLIPHVDKFPRARRFTLGDRIETSMLDVLEHLVEASYSRDKHAALDVANYRLQRARHLWRLAFELQAIALRSYEHGASLMLELGKQIGGWKKSAAREA